MSATDVMTIDDVVVRPARIDDADEITAHAKRITEDPEGFSTGTLDEVRTPDQYKTILEESCSDPRVLFLVAERAGRIVGEVNLRLFSRYISTSHVRVFGIGLDREVRRRGLGERMTRRAIDWAKANGVRRIELYVFASNAAAIALYEKVGFVREGLRKNLFDFGGRMHDDVVMALLL
jgi:RimJ/RimL family protein N-acetyltransferase